MVFVQSVVFPVLNDAERFWLPGVDKLARAIVQLVVKLHANVILVIPEVLDADAVYRFLVLQHIVYKEPETLVPWGDNGQGSGIAMVATVVVMRPHFGILCHARHGQAEDESE